MGITTEKFIRKPLFVDAVRISEANFDEIVTWCQGEALTDETSGPYAGKRYVKVRVHNPKNLRQTRAYAGDWLLYTERGYKVYTNKAFRASFDLVEGGPETVSPSLEMTSHEFSREPKHPELQKAALEGGHPIDPAEAVVAPPEGQRFMTSSTEYPEPIEIVEATPQAITDAVNEQTPAVQDTPTSPPPVLDGPRILSIQEQQKMDADEVRELIRSGEAVLAQDLVH